MFSLVVDAFDRFLSIVVHVHQVNHIPVVEILLETVDKKRYK